MAHPGLPFIGQGRGRSGIEHTDARGSYLARLRGLKTGKEGGVVVTDERLIVVLNADVNRVIAMGFNRFWKASEV